MSKSRDDVEDYKSSPFAGLQKNAVLQESRIFHQQIDPDRCVQVLTKILYLLSQGEVFTKEESTELFFACTKLFQSNNIYLRRMVYLVIKEICVDSDESLIVISCLSKDMVGSQDLFRANAIRVLSKIMDPSMLNNIERFLKQAVVDKNPFIVTSTLLAGHHICKHSPEVIRRWANELLDAYNRPNSMVQYHALSLMYRTKANDKVALSKTLSQFARQPPSSSLALALHVRMVAKQVRNLPAPPADLSSFLLSSLHSTHFPVQLEAARSLAYMDHPPTNGIAMAVATLQGLLQASTVHKHAALRVLSHISLSQPHALLACVPTLEALLGHSSRSLATLAVSVLLRAGGEGSVERLVRSVSGLLQDAGEDFKLVLVDALQSVGLRHAHKYSLLLPVLLGILREEGSLALKGRVVSCLLAFIDAIPSARGPCMDVLAEYMEDCEHPLLAARAVHTLARVAPHTDSAGHYVRPLCSRTILEAASVRAAAVSALARMGVCSHESKHAVLAVLRAVSGDADDEVRDRALWYRALLGADNTNAAVLLSDWDSPQFGNSANASYVPPTPGLAQPEATTHALAQAGYPPVFFPDFATLEHSLDQYLHTGQHQRAFNLHTDIVSLPAIPASASPAAAAPHSPAHAATVSPSAATAATASAPVFPADMPDLGPLWSSSAPVSLSEAAAECAVSLTTHTFPAHTLFAFHVQNNMPSCFIRVNPQLLLPQWHLYFTIPSTPIASGDVATAYVAFARDPSVLTVGPCPCKLQFTMSASADEEGDEDEYQLEPVYVHEHAYLRHGVAGCGLVEFKRQWEVLGSEGEVVKKFAMQAKDMQSVVELVLGKLGLVPCEGDSKVPSGARTFAVNAHGVFFGDVGVYCRAGFMWEQKDNGTGVVSFKIAVRSPNTGVAQFMANAIR